MPDTSTALIDQLVYIDNFLNNGTGDTPQLDVDGQLSLDLAAFADDSFIFPDEDKPKHPHDDENDDDHNNFAGRNNNEDFSARSNGNKLPTVDDNLPHDIDTNWLSEASGNGPPFSINGNQPSEGRKALANINPMSRVKEVQLEGNGGLGLFASDSQSGEQNGAIQDDGESFLRLNSEGIIPDLSHLPKFPVPPGAESSLIKAGLSHSQIDLLAALIAQHQSTIGNTEKSVEASAEQNGDPPVVKPSLTLPTPRSILPSHSGSWAGRTSTMESPESITSNTSSGYNSGSVTSTPQLGDGRNTIRPATEYDKRRRNTEASARFRIKRKLKEKEMGNRMMQLDELINKFEAKIAELEMENRLLKNLIIEKGDQRSTQEVQLLREKAQRQ